MPGSSTAPRPKPMPKKEPSLKDLYLASFNLTTPFGNPYYGHNYESPLSGRPPRKITYTSPDVASLQALRFGRTEEGRLLATGLLQSEYAARIMAKRAGPFVVPRSPDVWLEPGYGFNIPARFGRRPVGGEIPFPTFSFGGGGGGGGSGRGGPIVGLTRWNV